MILYNKTTSQLESVTWLNTGEGSVHVASLTPQQLDERGYGLFDSAASGDTTFEGEFVPLEGVAYTYIFKAVRTQEQKEQEQAL